MSGSFNQFGKWWLESMGRSKPAHRYIFEEMEIVSPAYPRNVSALWKATFLNLHPTLYAVAVGPDGSMSNLKSGYNTLPDGRYNIYYIDKQLRTFRPPRLQEVTLDGHQIAMDIAISYQVIDPFKALQVDNAVDTLIRLVQADVKRFIRSRKYDDICGEIEGRQNDDEKLTLYVRERHAARAQISKLFLISGIAVEEKLGERHTLDGLKTIVDEQEQIINKLRDQLAKNQQKPTSPVDSMPAGPFAPKRDNAPSRNNASRVRVFISYSRNDGKVASEIYKHLLDNGYIPWMDQYDLIPGQDWKLEIQKNIKNSDFFIACLSKQSVSEAGFVQKELKEALSVLDEMPEGQIFLIPIRVDDCIVPLALQGKQWLDWSSPNSREQLLRAIQSKEH